MPDKTCNAKFELANGETVTPCHLSKGHQGNHYGTCLGSICRWPQGIENEEELTATSTLTQMIARFGKAYGEQSFNNQPLNVAMEVGTHTGKRLKKRGKCEKCNTPTNWVVDVSGRVGAYWCGCD
jgi:hypothetical protein